MIKANRKVIITPHQRTNRDKSKAFEDSFQIRLVLNEIAGGKGSRWVSFHKQNNNRRSGEVIRGAFEPYPDAPRLLSIEKEASRTDFEIMKKNYL